MSVSEAAVGTHAMRHGIRFDAGRHHRARLGFVLLAMEQTVESDLYRHAPDGVGVFFTRAPMANAVTADNLMAMLADLPAAAALLVPEARPDVLCYACTSGSVVMGEDQVVDALQRGAPGVQATTLVSGVIRALRELEARKIVIATPYLDEVNRIEADYLAARGFDVLDIQGLNITDDADMVRVAPDYIEQFALSVDRPDAEAIFISCGALRAIDVIERIEAQTGKPVVTSNQAMLWGCLRLAGIADRLPGLGQLFRNF